MNTSLERYSDLMQRRRYSDLTEQEWLSLRHKDITSTEIAALFGLSPYLTQFELWHSKRAANPPVHEENERMRWGTRLQDSIAKGIAEDNGWEVHRMGEYLRISEWRIGASFDFEIFSPIKGLLEIKNVDALAYKNGWEVDGDNVEAPPHIELQIQAQMMVSGHSVAYIGALVGGNNVVVIKREPNLVIWANIEHKVKEFWKSIADNKEPEPDFKRDAKFIASLYQSVTPEKVLTATEEIDQLAMNYKHYQELEKNASDEKEAIKAKMLMLISDAEKVKGEKYTISANAVGPCHMEYDRKGYRNFKVTFKKEKQ